MSLILFIFLVSAAASFVFVPAVIRLLASHVVLDVPNARSSHTEPVPRGGGIGLLMPFAAGTSVLIAFSAVSTTGFAPALLLGATALAVLGFIDDLRSLPALTRLLVQGLVTALCLWMGDLSLESVDLPGLGEFALGDAAWPVTWVLVVGFTNMFNFMDGINGLAGFQTLLGAASLSILGILGGDPDLALPLALLSGGAVGFLYNNFPRARVFLGDVGSLPIGFILALAVLRVHQGAGPGAATPIWLPALLIWPCLFDASYTLINRALRGRSPFRAHRSHVYQRMVVAGATHTRVTLLYTAAMAACAGGAFTARAAEGHLDILIFWGIVGVSLILTVITVTRIRASTTER